MTLSCIRGLPRSAVTTWQHFVLWDIVGAEKVEEWPWKLFALGKDLLWEWDEIAARISYLPACEGIISLPRNKDCWMYLNERLLAPCFAPKTSCSCWAQNLAEGSLCSGRLPRERKYEKNPSRYPLLENNMVKEGGDTGGGVWGIIFSSFFHPRAPLLSYDMSHYL